jgi:hypothetical protein
MNPMTMAIRAGLEPYIGMAPSLRIDAEMLLFLFQMLARRRR